MNTKERQDDFRFDYPTPPWAFALLCYTLIAVVFCVFYSNNIPQEFDESLWVVLGSYALIISIWLWQWPAYFFVRRPGVTLSEDGITVNKYFAAWSEIKEVKHGPMYVWRNAQVHLILDRKKPKFFSRESFRLRNPNPIKLWIPGYEYVYTDIVPAIKRFCPDVPVSHVVEENILSPTRGEKPSFLLVALNLSAIIALLSSVFITQYQNFLSYMIVALLLSMFSTTLGHFFIPLCINARNVFLATSIQAPFLLAYAFRIHLFSKLEHIAIETIAVTGMTLAALGLYVLLFMKNLTRRLQATIALILMASPIAYYNHEIVKIWPSKKIITITSDGSSLIWGKDGKYLSQYNGEHIDSVINVTENRAKPIPVIKGANYVRWLDSKYHIRSVSRRNKNSLWVYEFESGDSYRLPAGEEFAVSPLRCVSPDRTKFAWLDCDEKRRNGKLRVWDLVAKIEISLCAELNKEVQWSRNTATWTSDSQLVLDGRSKSLGDDDDARLVLERVNIKTGKIESSVSLRNYSHFHPTHDFRYAFAGRDKLVLVDLATDKSTPLSSGGFPLAVAGKGYALRVVNSKAGNMLMRLELSTAMSTPIMKIPEETMIAGLSAGGRYVLLAKDEMLSANVLYVVDTQDKRIKKIISSGLGNFLGSTEFIAAIPAANPFAPNGESFLLEARGLASADILLYKIPENWDNPKPEFKVHRKD